MRKLAIVGAHGRMGQAVGRAAADTFDISARIVRPEKVTRDDEFGSLSDALSAPDVVVDISAPAASLRALSWCRENSVPFVSGTTGFSDDQLDEFAEAAVSIPVLLASNFSVGVNVIERLVELAAKAVSDWDIEIFEAHHRNKVDAPSGTALTLGEAAARGVGAELEDRAVWTRHGNTGPRKDGEIGFQVVRGGSVVGEHTVFYCGQGERIEITHRATDRAIFAQGAVRAARWMIGRQPGQYTMADVLFD